MRQKVSRAHVFVPTQYLDEIRDLAERRGVTMTELFKMGISIIKVIAKEEEAGRSLAIVEGGKIVSTIKLLK